jgi:hypothetical protein
MDDECQVHLRPERVSPVLEGGDHAEVPTTTPQGPQQLRVVLLVCGDEVAVRGHQVRGDQVVATEPVPATQPAQPAAKGEPGDPGRGHHTHRHGETERLGLVVQLADRDPARGTDRATLRVDPDPVH